MLIVPVELLPPVTPLTCQVMPAFVVLLTVAVNCRVWPVMIAVDVGATLTTAAVSPPAAVVVVAVLVVLVVLLLASVPVFPPQARVAIRQISISHSALGRIVFFIWTPVRIIGLLVLTDGLDYSACPTQNK